jgi:hypothetical protein
MLPPFSGLKRDEGFNHEYVRQNVPLKFRLLSIRLHGVTFPEESSYEAVYSILITTDLDLMICLSFPVMFKVVNACS